MTEIRSRRVRKVLSLEARATRFETRHDRAIARAAPLKARAEALRQTAQATELLLTGTQLGELRRARNERGVSEAIPHTAAGTTAAEGGRG